MKVRYAKTVKFSTDDNAVGVSITWPDPLTTDELSELKEFVAIWMRQLDRHSEWPAEFCDHGINLQARCPDCSGSALPT